jgi:hypothetical protein
MSGSSHGPGHETQDFTFTIGIWAVPASMALLAAYVLVVWFWSTASLSGEMSRKEMLGAVPGSEPLRIFRAQEDSVLNGFGYKNQEAGVVRIPIHQAMDLILLEAGRDTAAKHPKRGNP